MSLILLFGTLQSDLAASPDNLEAEALDSKVQLTWDEVDGATGYNVYQSTSPSSLGALIAENISSPTHLAVSLINEITYYFSVSSINEEGEGIPSNQVSAIPLAPPVTPVEPSPPPAILPGQITKHIQGPHLVRVKRETITFESVTYTQGQELYMPRDDIYENALYLGKVERVSGFDVN